MAVFQYMLEEGNMGENHKIATIQTPVDLFSYIVNLQNTLARDPNSWENNTLESYLDAMARWVKDSEGYYRNHNKPMPSSQTLQIIAEVLTASTMYE